MAPEVSLRLSDRIGYPKTSLPSAKLAPQDEKHLRGLTDATDSLAQCTFVFLVDHASNSMDRVAGKRSLTPHRGANTRNRRLAEFKAKLDRTGLTGGEKEGEPSSVLRWTPGPR